VLTGLESGFLQSILKIEEYDVAIIGIFSPKSLKMAGFKSWKGMPLYGKECRYIMLFQPSELKTYFRCCVLR
jgi:hypothetical protein